MRPFPSAPYLILVATRQHAHEDFMVAHGPSYPPETLGWTLSNFAPEWDYADAVVTRWAATPEGQVALEMRVVLRRRSA